MRYKKPKYSLGFTFGYFTVVRHLNAGNYLCKCVCGSQRTIRSGDFKIRKSCGCTRLSGTPRQVERWTFRRKGTLTENLSRGIYRNYKRAAEKRSYSFELTYNQFLNLIQQPCRYCTESPSSLWRGSSRKYLEPMIFKYNGVDRVDNSLGYTATNCVPCCSLCNNSKGTLPLSIWLDWIQKVYKIQFGQKYKEKSNDRLST